MPSGFRAPGTAARLPIKAPSRPPARAASASTATPAGVFGWQDLISLRWQIPMNFRDSGAYIMNSRTWGMASTMSDANGRPIMVANPTEGAPFLLGGSPVVINDLMPDVAPGATPVAFGNWQQVYTVVNRRGVTVQNDPFSGGWCNLFRFDARIGGAVVCPNAARLLRIRLAHASPFPSPVGVGGGSSPPFYLEAAALCTFAGAS